MPEAYKDVAIHFGTQSEFDQITHDSNTIHFCTDTNRCYVGDDEYTKSAQAVDSLSEINIYHDGVIYYIRNKRKLYIYHDNKLHELPLVGQFANDKCNSEVFNDYANNTLVGEYSHVEGQHNTLVGNSSHIEGCNNTASKVSKSCFKYIGQLGGMSKTFNFSQSLENVISMSSTYDSSSDQYLPKQTTKYNLYGQSKSFDISQLEKLFDLESSQSFQITVHNNNNVYNVHDTEYMRNYDWSSKRIAYRTQVIDELKMSADAKTYDNRSKSDVPFKDSTRWWTPKYTKIDKSSLSDDFWTFISTYMPTTSSIDIMYSYSEEGALRHVYGLNVYYTGSEYNATIGNYSHPESLGVSDALYSDLFNFDAPICGDCSYTRPIIGSGKSEEYFWFAQRGKIAVFYYDGTSASEFSENKINDIGYFIFVKDGQYDVYKCDMDKYIDVPGLTDVSTYGYYGNFYVALNKTYVPKMSAKFYENVVYGSDVSASGYTNQSDYDLVGYEYLSDYKLSVTCSSDMVCNYTDTSILNKNFYRSDSIIVLTYSGSGWIYNQSTVNISDFGILSVSGQTVGDSITIRLTRNYIMYDNSSTARLVDAATFNQNTNYEINSTSAGAFVRYSSDAANPNSCTNIHVEGCNNTVDGNSVHVSGDNNECHGDCVSVFGTSNYAEGEASLTNGSSNLSYGSFNLATGRSNEIHGSESMLSGSGNYLSGQRSEVSGMNNAVSASHTLVAGYNNVISGDGSIAVGYGLRSGESILTRFAGNQVDSTEYVINRYSEYDSISDKYILSDMYRVNSSTETFSLSENQLPANTEIKVTGYYGYISDALKNNNQYICGGYDSDNLKFTGWWRPKSNWLTDDNFSIVLDAIQGNYETSVIKVVYCGDLSSSSDLPTIQSGYVYTYKYTDDDGNVSYLLKGRNLKVRQGTSYPYEYVNSDSMVLTESQYQLLTSIHAPKYQTDFNCYVYDRNHTNDDYIGFAHSFGSVPADMYDIDDNSIVNVPGLTDKYSYGSFKLFDKTFVTNPSAKTYSNVVYGSSYSGDYYTYPISVTIDTNKWVYPSSYSISATCSNSDITVQFDEDIVLHNKMYSSGYTRILKYEGYRWTENGSEVNISDTGILTTSGYNVGDTVTLKLTFSNYPSGFDLNSGKKGCWTKLQIYPTNSLSHSAVFGRSNNVSGIGSGSLVAGSNNTVNGEANLITGMNNTASGSSYSSISGSSNTVNGGAYNIVSGSNNTVNSSTCAAIFGDNNKGQHHDIISGGNNKSSGSYQAISGSYNEIGGQYSNTSGSNNKINNAQSSLISGSNNKQSDEYSGYLNSSLLVGDNIDISKSSIYSSLISCRSSKLTNMYLDSTLISANNLLTDSDTNYNLSYSLISGYNIKLNGNCAGSLISGQYLQVPDTRFNSAAILGQYNDKDDLKTLAQVSGVSYSNNRFIKIDDTYYKIYLESSEFVPSESNVYELNSGSFTLSTDSVYDSSKNYFKLIDSSYNIIRISGSTVTDVLYEPQQVAMMIGNGSSDSQRSNALVLNYNGDLHISGTLYADGGIPSSDITVAPATTSKLGGIKVGDNLSIDDSGLLSSVRYVASKTSLGEVTIGKGLAVSTGGDVSISELNISQIEFTDNGFNIVIDTPNGKACNLFKTTKDNSGNITSIENTATGKTVKIIDSTV